MNGQTAFPPFGVCVYVSEQYQKLNISSSTKIVGIIHGQKDRNPLDQRQPVYLPGLRQFDLRMLFNRRACYKTRLQKDWYPLLYLGYKLSKLSAIFLSCGNQAAALLLQPRCRYQSLIEENF